MASTETQMHNITLPMPTALFFARFDAWALRPLLSVTSSSICCKQLQIQNLLASACKSKQLDKANGVEDLIDQCSIRLLFFSLSFESVSSGSRYSAPANQSKSEQHQTFADQAMSHRRNTENTCSRAKRADCTVAVCRCPSQ